MPVWKGKLGRYLAYVAPPLVALLVGVGAFLGFWRGLQIHFLGALASASLVGIFIWLMIQLFFGRSVNIKELIESIAITLGLIMSFYQIGIQPQLELACRELPSEYPNLWAPGPVVLYPPNPSYREVAEPILLVITNRGRARAVEPRLYVSVDDPFLISIFGVWSNGEWWQWVKGLQKELIPKQFSWVAGENYSRVSLTLSEVLPGESLEAYFLLLAPDPSRDTKANVRARVTSLNRAKEREFTVIWEKGRMKCGD